MKYFSIYSLFLALMAWTSAGLQAQPVTDQVQIRPGKTEVHVDESCRGKLEAGEPQLVKVNGESQIIIPLRNTSNQPITCTTRIALLRQDGSVIANPDPRPTGGLEGIARGFVGVVSLGVTEALMQERKAAATIVCVQEVAPGQQLQLKRSVCGIADSVASAEVELSVIPSLQEQASERDVRRQLDAKFTKIREQYQQQRKVEFDRWYALKDQLQAKKASATPMSADYKRVMDQYWAEHRAHMDRLNQIEQGFTALEAKQQQMIESALQ